MISRDELNARAKRLQPYQPVNRYTGTLNDPMQDAQSAYMGPEWQQYFGSLQKTQEDAQDAGMRYGIDYSGFGNTRSEDTMPRRRGTLADLGGDRLSDADAGRQFDEDVMRTRVGQLGLAAMQRQDQAQRDAMQQADIDKQKQDYEQFKVASAFQPPMGDTTIARQARPGQSELITGRPDIAATPADPRKVLETQIQRLPANHPLRMQMEKSLAAEDAAAATEKLNQTKADAALAATASAVTMTPDAIDDAAVQYNKTGVMPTLGMKDPGNRARITNRAAEMAREGGGTGADIAANKAFFKSDSSSLTGLQKQRDAVGAFEETALKNLDVFLDAAKKVPDLGSPLLNKPLRAISETGLGSADLAAYNAARLTVVPEFAKILSNPGLSGQLTDSARHEIEQVLSGDATLAQTLAVANTLKTDAANRRVSYDDQLKKVKERISKPASSSGSDAAKPAGGDYRKKYNY